MNTSTTDDPYKKEADPFILEYIEEHRKISQKIRKLAHQKLLLDTILDGYMSGHSCISCPETGEPLVVWGRERIKVLGE